MENDELKWWKESGLVHDSLVCKCGKEGKLQGSSNWHDGTGVLYMVCDCGKEWNAGWVDNKK